MPDLEEQILKRKYTLSGTDIPDTPQSTEVYIKVTPQGVVINWNNSNTYDETITGREEFQINITKDQIVQLKIFPRPDASEGDTYNYSNYDDYPELQIIHKDPYEVVDNFTTEIVTTQTYWIKALAKYLSKKLDINVVQE
jgi:hypothetical protein